MSFIIHYLKSFHFENKVYTETSYTRANTLNYDYRAFNSGILGIHLKHNCDYFLISFSISFKLVFLYNRLF